MIQKIKIYLITAAFGLMFSVPALVPTIAASAACSSIGSNIAQGVSGAATGNPSSADCNSSANVGTSDVAKIAHGIVNIFSVIVGVVAVIMVIYGGFRYITSGGDSGRVGGAKNSLIYALVGLVIVALAQLIVHFVLNQASSVPQ